MIVCVTEEDCKKYVFPFIHLALTEEEQAPNYELEEYGMAELRKVLDFAANDDYYPSFASKAAYLICTIAGSQHFTNGNKRLGVFLLMEFLILNRKMILLADLEHSQFKYIISYHFPDVTWEINPAIQHNPFTNFLYNLAIVIGDRNKWGVKHYDELKSKVTSMFRDMGFSV